MLPKKNFILLFKKCFLKKKTFYTINITSLIIISKIFMCHASYPKYIARVHFNPIKLLKIKQFSKERKINFLMIQQILNDDVVVIARKTWITWLFGPSFFFGVNPSLLIKKLLGLFFCKRKITIFLLCILTWK